LKSGIILKTQIAIFYCLMLSLITYGLNYHIGKAFIHLSALLSIFNIILAIKERSLARLETSKITFLMAGLLLLSSIITLTYFMIFNNPMAERHFANTFYPTILFAIILPSLKVRTKNLKVISYAAMIACFIIASSGILDYFSKDLHGYRTAGFLNMPIIYASTMALITSWICAEFFRALLDKKWIIGGICFLSTMVGFLAILLTGSRGPIIATIIIFIILFIHYFLLLPSSNKKIYTVIVLAITFIVMTFFLPQSQLFDGIKSRFESGIINVTNGFKEEKREPTSSGIRLDMWEASLVAIMDHPFTGIGSGNHTKYFPILNDQNRININTNIVITFDHMHNDFIQAWLSMGLIFGTLAFSFIIYSTLLFAHQVHLGQPAMVPLAVCICFILCGLTDVPAHNAASLSLFLLIIAMQLSILNCDKENTTGITKS
jgi:O-antigen ligase